MKTTPRFSILLGSFLLLTIVSLLAAAPGRALTETSCHARCADGDCWCVLCNCGCSTGVLTPNVPWCGERRPMVSYTTQNTGAYVYPFVGDAGEVNLSSNSVARQGSHGLVSTQSGGGFFYSPDPGFVGQDSFTFRICNLSGQCDYGTVLVDVLP